MSLSATLETDHFISRIRNADGFDLALHPVGYITSLRAFPYVGFPMGTSRPIIGQLATRRTLDSRAQ
jgi:hypothetical protein